MGEDQVQHIEVCRDLAAAFNHEFGETFVLPKAKVIDTAARVPGIDGEKMSKSYNNTLDVFEEPEVLRKQIMRIVTDSRPMEQAKEPEADHLFQLYSLFATDAERAEMAATYRRGGFGYGQVKKALATWPRDSSPRRASVAGSWRPTPRGSARSWATGPPGPGRRRRKCSGARRRLAGSGCGAKIVSFGRIVSSAKEFIA